MENLVGTILAGATYAFFYGAIPATVIQYGYNKKKTWAVRVGLTLAVLTLCAGLLISTSASSLIGAALGAYIVYSAIYIAPRNNE